MILDLGRLTAEVLDTLEPEMTRHLPEGWRSPNIFISNATPPEFIELAAKLYVCYQARMAIDAVINDSK